jgi:hypothetical protein
VDILSFSACDDTILFNDSLLGRRDRKTYMKSLMIGLEWDVMIDVRYNRLMNELHPLVVFLCFEVVMYVRISSNGKCFASLFA